LKAFDTDGALRLVLSGSESSKNLQVTILIRSNTPYNITASVQSQTAALKRLLVLSVEANGRSVAADAVGGVAVGRQFEGRSSVLPAEEENLATVDAAIPFKIFSGPRISLGGGLDSPQNALKVTLLLSVQARAAQEGWTLDLRVQGNETDMP
jgi:hypothetical protein